MERAYLQAAACKCTMATLWLEKPRDADLFIYLSRCATGDNGAQREQWRERDTARYVRPPRISQSALRTEGFVGGVVDAERCVVCFMRKWQIRIAGEQRIVPRARRFILSLRGAVILSFSAKFTAHGDRLVWNNASDFLAHVNVKSSFPSARPTN